ncbi:type IV pilus assembly protein PilM [Microbacterium trichothecenolyticum]|uniref:type IV pilus biogenesis protein PilM n=1 Tax=Microbacterium trichothecenolyticum TaxID=69370 RepID=UPI00285F3E21|nr:pilus assembly protein PilM [Microbacterium trichothecenolyticum]MDR7113313.1 type IV pilus assembly protein PilM [Microbacterium trichothecenolyticum]
MGKTIVGLEVTEESVRAAEISLGRKPQLVAYGEVPLPPEAARDSEVLDSGAVAVALRQLWTGAKFRSKDAVLGVASRRILVREYTTQAMRPDLLREALPYQVQDLLPVPASQAVLDFFPLSQDGDQVSGLLVAAVSENIEQIISTLAKVKVRAQAVDLAAFGLARVTAPLASPEETVATVSIGDHTTQVVISRGGVPLFVRLLPIDVATAATRRHNAEAVEPELELAAVAAGNGSGTGLTVPSRTRGSIRAATPPGVSDLAARLRSTLAFFGSRAASVPLSRVFVTGAGAAVEGILPALGAAIDTPMTIVSVGDVISMSTPPPAGEVALNLVGTVGIALGEAGK